MGYEVDFMPVGQGERSGDAIAVRQGNLVGTRSEQKVLVIDGGTRESGEALVAHIQKYYRTNEVDVVVSTHPDADHSAGLAVVLEKLKVHCLLMHQPWNHAEEISHLFDDGRVKPTGLEERAWRSLENARELEKLATGKAIPIHEPFSETFPFVLSPSKDFYEQNLPNFRCMPEPALLAQVQSIKQALFGAVKEFIKRIAETWFKETLTEPEPDATSAENNSSAVLLFDLGGEHFLFTADAGVPALTAAADRAKALGIDLRTVKYIQVPHHGSKRNVGPAILDRVLGPRLLQDEPNKSAFLSAAKDGAPKHPAKKVINAFQRRGARVYATQGKGLWHHSDDAPPREGTTDAVKLPFYQEVDE